EHGSPRQSAVESSDRRITESKLLKFFNIYKFRYPMNLLLGSILPNLTKVSLHFENSSRMNIKFFSMVLCEEYNLPYLREFECLGTDVYDAEIHWTLLIPLFVRKYMSDIHIHQIHLYSNDHIGTPSNPMKKLWAELEAS